MINLLIPALLCVCLFIISFIRNKSTPLHYAVLHGHLETVGALLRHGAGCGGGTNDADDDTMSPLILAIRSGQRNIVAILLESGASVDERERGGMLEYPLHAAVRCEDYQTLKMLLTKCTKVDCVDFM